MSALIITTPAPPPTSYSTNFPATSNPITGPYLLGGRDGLDWTNPQATSGLGAYGTQSDHNPPPYDDSIACLDPAQFNIGVRQYAQGTLFNNSASGSIEAEILLAWSITAHSASGYELDIIQNGGGLHVVRWNGAINNFTDLTPGGFAMPSFATGTIVRGQIDQNGVITVSANGSTIGTVTDTTYANIAGRTPGFGFFRETGASALNTFGLSDFSCGTF